MLFCLKKKNNKHPRLPLIDSQHQEDPQNVNEVSFFLFLLYNKTFYTSAGTYLSRQ